MTTENGTPDPLNIAELIRQAASHKHAWHVPKPDEDRRARPWQEILDGRIYPAGGAQTPDEYIKRASLPRGRGRKAAAATR